MKSNPKPKKKPVKRVRHKIGMTTLVWADQRIVSIGEATVEVFKAFVQNAMDLPEKQRLLLAKHMRCLARDIGRGPSPARKKGH